MRFENSVRSTASSELNILGARRVIKDIEDTHGIKIAEVRVTIDSSDSANGWSAANCVMVKGEHQDFGLR